MSEKFIGKTLEDAFDRSEGKVVWRSPSNIALVKYWGKHGIQLPRNPSLSFSLTNAHTETEVKYNIVNKRQEGLLLEFFFEGKKNEAFENRINKYLKSIRAYFPFLSKAKLEIHSKNSFPHSSGIASSASSMSALALCLTNIEYELEGKEIDSEFYHKASFVARLGSGSACRSVYKDFCIWGETELGEMYSDEYAHTLEAIHPVFQNLHDDILIVSSAKKSVSSSAGHSLMENNPFAATRYNEAKRKLLQLAAFISSGDVEGFGKIVEEEALSLHALMMCSDPSYVLMEPATLQVIKEIRGYRAESGTPIYFTLDAGPNVHVIYPDQAKVEARKFIEENLLRHCERGQHIFDHMGKGPTKMTE